MRLLADTSVLVAALVASHPRHDASWRELEPTRRGHAQLVLAAHSLAELYAVLTKLPLRPRISPATARTLAESHGLRPAPQGIAEVISLSGQQYVDVVDELAERSLAGGIAYDALLVKAAQIAEVDQLLTLNPAHFRRLWPDAGDRIREPG